MKKWSLYELNYVPKAHLCSSFVINRFGFGFVLLILENFGVANQ